MSPRSLLLPYPPHTGQEGACLTKLVPPMPPQPLQPKHCYHDLRSALVLDPKHPQARVLLQMMVDQAQHAHQDAGILAVQGKLQHALQCINTAIQNNPLDPRFFLFRYWGGKGRCWTWVLACLPQTCCVVSESPWPSPGLSFPIEPVIIFPYFLLGSLLPVISGILDPPRPLRSSCWLSRPSSGLGEGLLNLVPQGFRAINLNEPGFSHLNSEVICLLHGQKGQKPSHRG